MTRYVIAQQSELKNKNQNRQAQMNPKNKQEDL